MVNKKHIKVVQVKSSIGSTSRQKASLLGLGLTRIGRARVLEDSPSVRGMVTKVSHLVKLCEV